ncbi:MAG: N-6 DNA methylase [Bacteroidaceae bacterium]|jgi:type I restriction enzyme M protein|nr:N-6 DNA methylase [Bacteroidaceae bacterium]
MADSTISNKVWNIAGILFDGGVSNSDYLEQITYLLFLKMVDEDMKMPEELRWNNWRNLELPTDCDWSLLMSKSGEELKEHYGKILSLLSKKTGMIGEIYRGAQNKIQTPEHLRKVIQMIDGTQWNSLSEDVKGDIYESLLERIAQDTKSGAGQYFTPRALIKTIVKCVNPELGKVIVDPCCGSGGFLLAAKDFLQGKYTTMTGQQTDDLKLHTFYGTEIVPNTYRLCLMNLLLHGIGEFGGVPPIKCADSLASAPSDNDLCEYVMTNPPFGKKSSTTIEVQEEDKETGEVVTKIKKAQDNYVRADFIATTSNKQLNFLQHIKSLLKVGGTAAVVLPDNVLFEGGAGETIRKNILKTCDLHTILRLPTGLFYAQGVKANVLFFEKKPTSENAQTKEVWIYDYRTNVKHTLKQNPLRETDLQDFVDCYRPDDRHHRQETYHAESNPDGRWRKFTYDEVLGRDKTSLDITWIKQGEESEDLSLPELISIIKEKSNNITEAVAELEKLLENLES